LNLSRFGLTQVSRSGAVLTTEQLIKQLYIKELYSTRFGFFLSIRNSLSRLWGGKTVTRFELLEALWDSGRFSIGEFAGTAEATAAGTAYNLSGKLSPWMPIFIRSEVLQHELWHVAQYIEGGAKLIQAEQFWAEKFPKAVQLLNPGTWGKLFYPPYLWRTVRYEAWPTFLGSTSLGLSFASGLGLVARGIQFGPFEMSIEYLLGFRSRRPRFLQ
jgi:hypothetical protein